MGNADETLIEEATHTLGDLLELPPPVHDDTVAPGGIADNLDGMAPAVLLAATKLIALWPVLP